MLSMHSTSSPLTLGNGVINRIAGRCGGRDVYMNETSGFMLESARWFHGWDLRTETKEAMSADRLGFHRFETGIRS